jgi:hypothetical protein
MLVPGDRGDFEFHMAVGAGLAHRKPFDLSLDDCLLLHGVGKVKVEQGQEGEERGRCFNLSIVSTRVAAGCLYVSS